MKVKLGDVVKRIKNKVDKDNCDLELYVGGEHYDTAEFLIKRFGKIDNSTIGPAFNKSFKKGDVLLMSRRPNLRKAGLVSFDGICSEVSYVLQTKNNKILMQEFLPFILQTDSFWDFADKNKKGSTNYFLNWSDFAEYEFDLPSLEEQERLAKILWKIEESKTQASDSIKKINNLIQVTSKKDYESFCQFDLKKIKELLEVQKKSGIKAGESLSKGEYIFFTSGSSNAWCNKYLLDGEYLIFNTGGSMLIQYYNGKFSYSTDTMVIKCKDNLTKYLFYYLSSINDELDYNFFRGSGLRHLNKKEFFNMDIKIPSKEKTDDFVNKLENLNSIKKQLLIDLKDKSFLQKQIIKEAFNV